MKMQANKNRTERSFPVGTWVYVKLQPYVQTTNAARANQKLSYRFFGPYLIIEKVGSVAYKLQLPSTSAIYLVFHVSQLKAAIPVTHTADQLQNTIDGLQVPQQVLQKRVASSGSEVRLQALIQWSGLPARLATWEDVEALRQRFPEHQLGGKLDLNKGDVSSPGAATEEASADDVTHGSTTEDGPRRSKRERRPNERVQGPDWV
jgi:hypothetical protein